MLRVAQMFKLHLVVALAILLAFAATLSSSRADTGLVAINVAKAGFIVGVGGGSGTLRFQKRSYPLTVSGISVGAVIGASKTELMGRAYNMRDPSDIVGTYTAVGAGVAVAGGGGAVRLKNSKGVILELQGRKIGAEFSISLSGLEIGIR